MSITELTKPFYLSDDEQALAKSTLETLIGSSKIVRQPDGSLPENINNFIGMLSALADGQAISAIPKQIELTLSQAAEFLCVSEDYLTELLNSGEIESRFVNGRRLIAVNDLLEYDAKATKQQKEAFRELVRLSGEMGLYDD